MTVKMSLLKTGVCVADLVCYLSISKAETTSKKVMGNSSYKTKHPVVRELECATQVESTCDIWAKKR